MVKKEAKSVYSAGQKEENKISSEIPESPFMTFIISSSAFRHCLNLAGVATCNSFNQPIYGK